MVAWGVAGKQAAGRSQRPEKSQKSRSAKTADGTRSYSEYARIVTRIKLRAGSEDAMTPTIEATIVDITTLDVDAVVNAANEGLQKGGGVCGAIFEAAGVELEEARRKLSPCPTGEARITPGFKLPAKYIVHAVGPIWHGGSQGEPELLASAYRSALKLAEEHGCQSIAFPAISTGIFGYPLQQATAITVKTIRECVAGGRTFQRVVFACFSDEVLVAYQAAGIGL